MANVARRPGIDRFSGCDTPEIGGRLREGRFDALLVMGWHLKSYLQGLFAAKRLRIPVLVRGDSQLGTPRSPFKKLVKRITYPSLLRLFDAALFVGQRSRAYYKHYGYPADRLFFSPHSVDTKAFSRRATLEARRQVRERLGIMPETKVLLFAGKLAPFKRPMDLIAAAAQCRANGRNVEVIVAGDGELRHDLVEAAVRSNLPAHFLGFCNQTEMPAAYAAADCLVLPSDGRETWGLVVNESLACGCPVIVSDACGCAPDLARDGRVGRCYPVGSVHALARHIFDVIAAPPSSAEISEITNAYSLEVAAAGIVSAVEYVRRSWP